MTVVIAHFTFSQFIAGVPYQGSLAGLAVTVFFVLSGYVISYVADQKERTLRQYATSRLARVYSVAVPAVLLTLVIDFYLMKHGAGESLPLYEYRSLWKYLPVFLVFGSEIAWFHAPVFGDGVFWSLSYEVWYYVAFAMFFYLKGARRVVFGLGALLIFGLPALLYFPIWVLGAAIYHLHQKVYISPRIATIGAFSSGAAIVALLASGAFGFIDVWVNSALHGWPSSHLHNSMNFPSHYIGGVIMGVHIFFVRYCPLNFLSGKKLRSAIVYAASFTFAIYLSHRPFMNFWAVVIGHDPHSAKSIFVLADLVLFSCWCFGFASEKQKERWRGIFRWLLGSRAIANRVPT